MKRKKIKGYFFYTSPHYLDRKTSLRLKTSIESLKCFDIKETVLKLNEVNVILNAI